MKISIHQQDITIGDLDSSKKRILECLNQKNSNEKSIHLFPELFLGGYPLQDLILDKSFIESYNQCLKEIGDYCKSLSEENNNCVLFGGIDYYLNNKSLPTKIYNVIFQASPGSGVKPIYQKKLLPNYDIFDEQKYFTEGNSSSVVNIFEKNFALLICEDMWTSQQHEQDPVRDILEEIKSRSLDLDGIINLSASPFSIEKNNKRISRAKEISQQLGAPFFYANSVGLNDEILFDGRSFILDNDNLIYSALFENDQISFDLQNSKKTDREIITTIKNNTWEDLFSPRIDTEKMALNPLSIEAMEEIISGQMFAINSYCQKTGIKNISVALSGGIDSALVLALAWMTKKKYNLGELEAIFMPGHYSSIESYELSRNMCKNLDIPFYNFPIKFLHQNLRMQFNDNLDCPLEGLADENIQSRLRGAIIYGRSNQKNSLVLNTSNKSELSVGYSTLYGDSVGAISILGDLFKTEIFQLSKFINESFKTQIDEVVPHEIIARPPTAELRSDQKDEDSLPPYERLDFYLESLLSHQITKEDLISLGFDKEEVLKTVKLLKLSEFKRFQFCPIIKLKNKSFGFGRRMPILKK